MESDMLLQRHEFEAVVVDTEDPEKSLRVKVRVIDLAVGVPEKDLPWATYKLPVGARAGEGDFTPVQKGDIVWVDFPYFTHGHKDTRRPRITGSVHHHPDNIPQLPPEAFRGDGIYSHKRSHNEPAPATPEYHRNKCYRVNGILIEVTDNSYRVTHLESGSAFELCKSGDTVLHSEKSSHHSSAKDTENHAGKDLTESVGGNWSISVSGSANINVSGEAKIQAAEINMNNGVGGNHNVLRACDKCLVLGIPHGSGSPTVLAGD